MQIGFTPNISRRAHGVTELKKIQRELHRLLFQLVDPITSLLDAVPQFLHDRQFYNIVKVTEGDRTLSNSKLAVYLLYQPGSLLSSTSFTVRHLVEKGYGVIAVSNAPLLDKDRKTLLSSVSLLIERPNYGYDFGGYRDALRVLRDRQASFSRLLLLNDSIWFPLQKSETLLAEMEQATVGLTGPMFERKSGRRHAGHFESYMLMIGPEALAAPAFAQFWSNYRVSSVRRKVLARGEKSFSRALLDKRVSTAILASRQRFTEAIAEQTGPFLQRAVLYAEHDTPEQQAIRRSLLELNCDDFDAQERFRAHIIEVARRGNIQEHFPFAAMSIFNLPFLKKRQSKISITMRRAYLRAISDGMLPCPDELILREILSLTPEE